MSKKLKLFKFRSLGGFDEYCRVKQIIETGEFWHAKFWDMNDPMEGVFQVPAVTANVVSKIFSGKANRVICSFSGAKGIKNPILWGYYANGFRGCAIEVEVAANDVYQMQYAKSTREIRSPSKGEDVLDGVQLILTWKQLAWKHEDEYRSIREHREACSKNVGDVRAVHFGMPYQNIRNRDQVIAQSKSLKCYFARCDQLATLASSKGISCHQVHVNDGKVVSKEGRPEESLAKPNTGPC